jgi:hypothetical protein
MSPIFPVGSIATSSTLKPSTFAIRLRFVGFGENFPGGPDRPRADRSGRDRDGRRNLGLVRKSKFSRPNCAATSSRTSPDRLDQFHAFGKGQFVRWKSGLKNRKFPDYGDPAIVAAVLPSPIFDPSEVAAASPYFQEPLALIIGTFRDDDFLEFRIDCRSFEPFEP